MKANTRYSFSAFWKENLKGYDEGVVDLGEDRFVRRGCG